MKYQEPVVEATLLKRNNRFIGEVELKGKTFPVHIPNTGSLKTVLAAPQSCRIREVLGRGRKIPWSLEMLKIGRSWVGVNTQWPNSLVKESWEKKKYFTSYPYCQSEVKISSSSRIDLVFWKDKNVTGRISEKDFKNHKFHFVEVKNVTMKEGDCAIFPDAKSERGQKHLRELRSLLKKGHSCEMVYVVQRGDCKNFSSADEIDPVYGKELRAAVKDGLKVTAFACQLSPLSICLKTDTQLKIKL